MAVSVLSNPPCCLNPSTPFTDSNINDMDRRKSMFGSLKNKIMGNKSESSSPTLQRTGSGTSKASKAGPSSQAGNNPFTYQSSPTRRPAQPGMNPFNNRSTEPPPAYSAPAPDTLIPGPIRTSADDPYAFLSSFDTIFLIDDSGSMAGRSWRETAEALKMIAPICTAHDQDGIDIMFLNAPDRPIYKNITTSSTVSEIFQTVSPRGGTPTGQRLNQILKPYLKDYERNPNTTKPINIIMITDGVPSDDVEAPIISAAKKLDKLDAPAWQVGIQFFQVGREAEARKHLKQLDDELADIAGDDELRDMVDTMPYKGEGDAELTADGILKVVLGSVVRRLDRKRSDELHRKRC